MPPAPLSRVILYVRDISKVATFYQKRFDFSPITSDEPGWLELSPPAGDCTIALHQASKAQKRSSEIKLVFGVVHDANGVQCANARDPAGNSISISNRGRR